MMQVDVSSLPTLREGEEFTDANGQPPEATASTRPQVCRRDDGGRGGLCMFGGGGGVKLLYVWVEGTRRKVCVWAPHGRQCNLQHTYMYVIKHVC